MNLSNSLKLFTCAFVTWLATNSATSAFFASSVVSNDNSSPRPLQRNAAFNDPDFLFPKNKKDAKPSAIIKTTIAEMTPSKCIESKSPKAVYTKACSIIDSNFVDQTFNHQNWNRWTTKYSNSIHTAEDARKAIDSALTTLGDRYTFYTEQTADKFRGSEEPSAVCGVGLQLGVQRGTGVLIIDTIDGSAAEKAGVKKHWILRSVDGTPTAKATLEEIANQIRGEAGTCVTLSFLDGTTAKILTLPRSRISVPTVIKTCILKADIGYVRINSLRETTSSELRKELSRMATTTNGLILDLRDCDGVAFSDALEIADMFSSKEECIAQVKLIERKKLVTRNVYSSGKPLYSKPLAILANRGTSGSPEIIVAALRDNGATTFGTNTDGNATIQKEFELGANETLYVTSGVAVSPSRAESFYLRGLSPDVFVAPVIYYGGCGGGSAILENGPWYLYPAVGPALDSEEEVIMADCQLATAYQSLTSKSESYKRNFKTPAQKSN